MDMERRRGGSRMEEGEIRWNGNSMGGVTELVKITGIFPASKLPP